MYSIAELTYYSPVLNRSNDDVDPLLKPTLVKQKRHKF